MVVADRRRKLDVSLSEYRHLERTVADETVSLERANKRYETALSAQKLTQVIAEGVQNQAHRQIASVVSRCLESVFQEDAYQFKIGFERKRGKTEANLLFARDGYEVEPTDAAGGGAVDVAAFALRLACLVLARPKRRRLLILDEPLKHLNGAEYQDRVEEMIETLAKDLGVQFIIVSDDLWLRPGKVIEL